MKITPRFYVRQSPYTGDFQIFLGGGDGENILRAKPIELSVEKFDYEAHDKNDPLITIREDDILSLELFMDQLWALGIRPRDIGTPGHLAATKSHLKDMRSLVSHVLNCKFAE